MMISQDELQLMFALLQKHQKCEDRADDIKRRHVVLGDQFEPGRFVAEVEPRRMLTITELAVLEILGEDALEQIIEYLPVVDHYVLNVHDTMYPTQSQGRRRQRPPGPTHKGPKRDRTASR